MQLISIARDTDEVAQIAVGNGINLANSYLTTRFENLDSFQSRNQNEQQDFADGLEKMSNELIKDDPQTALGFDLYAIWLRALIGHDDTFTDYCKEEMATLSRKADI